VKYNGKTNIEIEQFTYCRSSARYRSML